MVGRYHFDGKKQHETRPVEEDNVRLALGLTFSLVDSGHKRKVWVRGLTVHTHVHTTGAETRAGTPAGHPAPAAMCSLGEKLWPKPPTQPGRQAAGQQR
jgi:hypothetical protein